MSTKLCLALGVIPCWTTMMALVMFSSCILVQYVLIVLIPILGSSGKKTNIWSVGSSLWATSTTKSLLAGLRSLGLSPNCTKPVLCTVHVYPLSNLLLELVQGLVQLVLCD